MALSNTAHRPYHSPLREQQAEATREGILAGLVRSMADGVTEVSIPAVARSANVSVATVYRHFPSKRALFEALPGHFARMVGMDRPSIPSSLEEFENSIRALFVMYDRLDDVARAAMVSQLGEQARKAQMPLRLGQVEAAIGNCAPGLMKPARERVARLALVLTTSATGRTLSAAGRTPQEAAEDVIWALRTAIEGETRRQRRETTAT